MYRIYRIKIYNALNFVFLVESTSYFLATYRFPENVRESNYHDLAYGSRRFYRRSCRQQVPFSSRTSEATLGTLDPATISSFHVTSAA